MSRFRADMKKNEGLPTSPSCHSCCISVHPIVFNESMGQLSNVDAIRREWEARGEKEKNNAARVTSGLRFNVGEVSEQW